MFGYYFITDTALSRRGNFSDVKNALKAKVKIVQYRNNSLNIKEMYAEALQLRRLCKNITFLINDRVDIALAVGASGVHLGQADLPLNIARRLLGKKKIIGVSVHNLKEALIAEKQGADYLSVGPIFKTTTKLDARKPVGVKLIRRIKRYISLPLVAIGGINLSNAARVIGAGADGICAICAVVTKSDVRQEIEKFQALFQREFMQINPSEILRVDPE